MIPNPLVPPCATWQWGSSVRGWGSVLALVVFPEQLSSECAALFVPAAAGGRRLHPALQHHCISAHAGVSWAAVSHSLGCHFLTLLCAGFPASKSLTHCAGRG